ncbi:MAG TPA: hypothetical protein VMK32_00110 [Burkholderiaceae bacterium]|nr:hypothetical protein [Burkholderiaceae bacterium]
MSVSIAHIGVRMHPQRVAQISARADSRAFTVMLDDDVIQHLCGDTRDENAMLLALTRNQDVLRIAIAAYVGARGVPLDDQFLLSWRDFGEASRGLVNAPRAAG